VSSKDRGKRAAEQTTPQRFAETTPPLTPSSDYTYVLETVMRMQHGLGKLDEAVTGLKERQVEQGKKLDTISKQIYAAIVLLAVVGAVLTFFARSINDAITNRLLASPATVVQQPRPTVTPTPTPPRASP
jgi:hypothetical protein